MFQCNEVGLIRQASKRKKVSHKFTGGQSIYIINYIFLLLMYKKKNPFSGLGTSPGPTLILKADMPFDLNV